jgi:hypothetical protein
VCARYVGGELLDDQKFIEARLVSTLSATLQYHCHRIISILTAFFPPPCFRELSASGVRNEDEPQKLGIAISCNPPENPAAASVDTVLTVPESELRFHVLKCKVRGVNLAPKDAS